VEGLTHVTIAGVPYWPGAGPSILPSDANLEPLGKGDAAGLLWPVVAIRPPSASVAFESYAPGPGVADGENPARSPCAKDQFGDLGVTAAMIGEYAGPGPPRPVSNMRVLVPKRVVAERGRWDVVARPPRPSMTVTCDATRWSQTRSQVH
jgi:hypothetical protein